MVIGSSNGISPLNSQQAEMMVLKSLTKSILEKQILQDRSLDGIYDGGVTPRKNIRKTPGRRVLSGNLSL